MAFWKSNSTEARRQFRFKLSIDGVVYWWVKSAELPSSATNVGEYTIGNHTYKFPGILKWNPVTVEIADIGAAATNKGSVDLLIDIIEKKGYKIRGTDAGPQTAVGGIQKQMFNEIRIEQIKANGLAASTWVLKNAFLNDINYGRGDYESDEINSVSFTITYNWAEQE